MVVIERGTSAALFFAFSNPPFSSPVRFCTLVPMAFESLSPDYDAPEADYDQLRIPPHSVQAEQSVIGGLMLDRCRP